MAATERGASQGASHTTEHPLPRRVATEPEPIAGEAFRAATKAGIADPQDRKVAALIGAYRDAGVFEPGMTALAARLRMPVEEVDRRLEALERDGKLWIRWAPFKLLGEDASPQGRRQRNLYVCLWIDTPRSALKARDAAKIARRQAAKRARRQRYRQRRAAAGSRLAA